MCVWRESFGSPVFSPKKVLSVTDIQRPTSSYIVLHRQHGKNSDFHVPELVEYDICCGSPGSCDDPAIRSHRNGFFLFFSFFGPLVSHGEGFFICAIACDSSHSRRLSPVLFGASRPCSTIDRLSARIPRSVPCTGRSRLVIPCEQ